MRLTAKYMRLIGLFFFFPKDKLFPVAVDDPLCLNVQREMLLRDFCLSAGVLFQL